MCGTRPRYLNVGERTVTIVSTKVFVNALSRYKTRIWSNYYNTLDLFLVLHVFIFGFVCIEFPMVL